MTYTVVVRTLDGELIGRFSGLTYGIAVAEAESWDLVDDDGGPYETEIVVDSITPQGPKEIHDVY